MVKMILQMMKPRFREGQNSDQESEFKILTGSGGDVPQSEKNVNSEKGMCVQGTDNAGQKKCCVFSCGKKCLDLKQDVCEMPNETGPCLAFFIRWWYDKKNNTCSTFVYGGCQGNNNNFQSEANCLNTCKNKRFP
nr:eppin-like [Macaca nemestrina]